MSLSERFPCRAAHGSCALRSALGLLIAAAVTVVPVPVGAQAICRDLLLEGLRDVTTRSSRARLETSQHRRFCSEAQRQMQSTVGGGLDIGAEGFDFGVSWTQGEAESYYNNHCEDTGAQTLRDERLSSYTSRFNVDAANTFNACVQLSTSGIDVTFDPSSDFQTVNATVAVRVRPGSRAHDVITDVILDGGATCSGPLWAETAGAATIVVDGESPRSHTMHCRRTPSSPGVYPRLSLTLQFRESGPITFVLRERSEQRPPMPCCTVEVTPEVCTDVPSVLLSDRRDWVAGESLNVLNGLVWGGVFWQSVASVQGVAYTNLIGMHPTDGAVASATFRVPPRASRFTVVAGNMDETPDCAGDFRASILVAGSEVASAGLGASARLRPMSVSLAPGTTQIELRVDSAGSNYCDHAAWLNPTFAFPRQCQPAARRVVQTSECQVCEQPSSRPFVNPFTGGGS